MPRQKNFTGLPIPSDPNRFWDNVEVRSPGLCWPWLGCLRRSGYGSTMFVWQGKSRNLYPHRVSVAMSGRDIPDGMAVDHICRDRACVNPGHLRVVSMEINSLENSLSVSAVNASKTLCVRGHQFSSKWTRINKRGYRICNACRRMKYAEGLNPNRRSQPRT